MKTTSGREVGEHWESGRGSELLAVLLPEDMKLPKALLGCRCKWALGHEAAKAEPRLDAKFFCKFYYAKRRFSITSKCRHMHEVLNVDEIKN
jgi:hypothetical protein